MDNPRKFPAEFSKQDRKLGREYIHQSRQPKCSKSQMTGWPVFLGGTDDLDRRGEVNIAGDGSIRCQRIPSLTVRIPNVKNTKIRAANSSVLVE